jgi:hypothetical protein
MTTDTTTTPADTTTTAYPAKWSDEWWATVARPGAQRCTAHRSNGSGRCAKPAMDGQKVCRNHGGAAPQAKRAARKRLEEAADRMARELLKIAVDDNVPESVKLAAVKDALDRAGVSARTAVDVEVTAKPYQVILENLAGIEGGSRAEFRRSQGIADDSDTERANTPALGSAQTNDPIDAEIIDEGDELIAAMRHQQDYADPMTPDDDDWPSDEPIGGTYNPLAPTGPPPDAQMTFEDAVSAAGDMRRRAAADARARGHATVRRGQRALPPGRSA